MALTGDAASLVAALERLRDGGFDVAEMSVGAVSIKLHRAPAATDRDDERPERAGILEQFGGDLFRQVAAGPRVPGVDLQPVFGGSDG